MTIESILSQIDDEIRRLTQVRQLLASAGSGTAAGPRRKAKAKPGKSPRKRVLSADARKRIADAQRRRWAAQRAKSKKESA